MSGTNRLVVSRALAQGNTQAEIAKMLANANVASKPTKKVSLKKR